MSNIKYASTRNIVFPYNICEKKLNDKGDSIQCGICKACIHLKCNKSNHLGYKYLQGSSDSWFCLCCCSSIFSFRFLTNKDFSSSLYGRNVSENVFNKKILSI